MAISLKKWLLGKFGRDTPTPVDVEVKMLFDDGQQFYLRLYAFSVCVNAIADAMSLCDIQTLMEGKPTEGREYYTWNIEPNRNQNSSTFFKKLIVQLFLNNEALIVALPYGGREQLYVADSFTPPEFSATAENVYTDVTVGQTSFSQTFRESEVMHLKLNNVDVNLALNELYRIYTKLIGTSLSSYGWKNGRHLKVHVNQIASGTDNFKSNFAEMIAEQVKPFLESDRAILPEFDGYEYEDFDKSSGSGSSSTTRDIKDQFDDILAFTAAAFNIPPVLLQGQVAGTSEAVDRWLTTCIDPICEQLENEINRKRYGFTNWEKGNRVHVDSTTINHFDVFKNAASVEKLIGSAAFSVNDVLKAAGRAPLPYAWADEHYLTKNIASIDEAATKQGGEE